MNTLNDFQIFMSTMRKRFHKAMSEVLAPYKLNGMHALYLKTIKENPGITLRELSDKLRCDYAHTSRAIAVLEEKEFVTDDRKNASNKKYKLFLSQSGIEVENYVAKKMQDFHMKTLDILSKDEQKIFLDLMKKLMIAFADE